MEAFETIVDFYRDYWRRILIIVVCIVAAYLLFFFRIHALLPGYNEAEIATQQATQNIHTIWNNPSYAPYKLVLWVAHQLGVHSVLATRVLSAGFGLVAVGLFFYVVKAWFSTRITIVATVLFATSGAVLHPARFGSPIILQMSALVIFAIVLFYQAHRDALPGWAQTLTKYALAVLLLSSLYVPGTVWFLLLGATLLHRKIYDVLRKQSIRNLAIITGMSLVLIAPLVYISWRNPTIGLYLLGLPSSLPDIATIWHNFLNLGSLLVWQSNIQPAISLIGAPLYGVISLALIFLGFAAQVKPPRLHTNYFLLLAIPVALLLGSLGGPITYVMVVPLLGLLMAGGLFYLLDQWFQVFPRNPIAKIVGVALLSILIGFSIFYQARSYYVAWPHAKATKAVYTLQQPK